MHAPGPGLPLCRMPRRSFNRLGSHAFRGIFEERVTAAWTFQAFAAGAPLANLNGSSAQETDPENLRTIVVFQDVNDP